MSETSPEPERGDLFDQMVGAGHAAFTLARAPFRDLTGREQALVQAAVEAGVLGALGVLRERGVDTER